MGNSCSPGCVADDVFDGVFLCCPFFPRDVLDESWDLIESVSGGFPTYSSVTKFYIFLFEGVNSLSKHVVPLGVDAF